jgi:imidazolonepropionase-like amidohydrolase
MNKVTKFLFCLLLVCAVPVVAADSGNMVLVGGRVYASPTAAPLDDAVVVIHDGKIVSVGKQGLGTGSGKVLDCSGKVIVAGFWNSHVHFTEDAWDDAAHAPAAKLEAHMQEMLTRWGFTTVFDIASIPENTLALRQRVESGEIAGPKIYTTAGEIYPKGGIPVYLPEKLARQLTSQQAATPEDAARLARREMELGGDGVKLFTGAIVRGEVLPMDVAIVKAAVEVAHAAGKPVFAHPSNHVGTDNALAGGVDVLAHLIPMETNWTAEELQRMKRQHTAVIPTLAMFLDEERKFGGSEDEKRMVLEHGLRQLKELFDQGSTVLFGTDVGYTQLYDTTSEYEYMARAGMSWHDILASLTTNPSSFFKAGSTGRVEQGMAADLVVLDGDPAADVRNFAKVAYTLRAGKVIYSGEKK